MIAASATLPPMAHLPPCYCLDNCKRRRSSSSSSWMIIIVIVTISCRLSSFIEYQLATVDKTPADRRLTTSSVISHEFRRRFSWLRLSRRRLVDFVVDNQSAIERGVAKKRPRLSCALSIQMLGLNSSAWPERELISRKDLFELYYYYLVDTV